MVTAKAAVDLAVKTADDRFGRLDVVVNNAGYGLFSMIEEVTEQQARDQFEPNVFGALWVTQAVLPYLREQGSGHIVQVSSIGGLTAFPALGVYNASKWALEGMSQALAAEVAGFGIKVTIVEPAAYATDWGGSSAVHSEALPAYQEVREGLAAYWSTLTPGDPRATAAAILQVVDAEEPPLRFFLGAGLLDAMRAEHATRVAAWEEWNDASEAATGSGSAA